MNKFNNKTNKYNHLNKVIEVKTHGKVNIVEIVMMIKGVREAEV